RDPPLSGLRPSGASMRKGIRWRKVSAHNSPLIQQAPLTVQPTFQNKSKRKGPYKGVRTAAILKAFKAKLRKGLSIKEAGQEIAEERNESFASVERTYYRYRKLAD